MESCYCISVVVEDSKLGYAYGDDDKDGDNGDDT